MNVTKFSFFAATVALSLGAGIASAATLDIDTLQPKSVAVNQSGAQFGAYIASAGAANVLEIATLAPKFESKGTLVRAEVRKDAAMASAFTPTLNH